MSAPKTFAVYEKKHASGNVGYRVDLGLVNGKRTFKNFPSRVKAQEFSSKCLKAEAQKHPSLLAEIDAVTRHEVLAAMARLKEHRASITDAVDFFLKHSRPVKADATIGHVIEEFRAVKGKAGLSKKYLDTSSRCFFGPFRDHFKDGLITEVTADVCEKYIYGHKGWNATSRATHIRHLNVLFNFAIDKGYASLNPFEKVQRPKRQANNSADKVLPVESVIKLLQYALTHDYKPECAALVLVLFCGVRVDEVDRLTWDKIKLDEDKPVVVLDQTKANHRRVNPIPKNALEWLKLLRGTGKVTPANYQGRMRYLRKASKAECKQNSSRISFASYHVAMHEDAAKTSLLLGHKNPSLLWETYRALVTKEDAKRYWRITPTYDGKSETVQQVSDEEASRNRAKRLAAAVAED